MKKIYELWLDESGDFKNEAELKGTKRFASLIGGFLIEKEKLSQINLDELLYSDLNHAMEMDPVQKRDYVLPILEKMQEFGAVQVFFENTEYEDDTSNRQLYLRMMAEGILQLMQMLNAGEESISLEVLIAQRQDMDADSDKRRIAEEEYLTALKQCIGRKRRGHQIFLHEDSKIHFLVKAAHKEKKLQLADFACNTRLTRKSVVFETCKDRVAALHERAYLFKLSEVGTSNYIKRCLVQEDIADALMELYLSRDKAEHQKMLQLILKRIDHTNYRLMKSQLKQYTSEIIAYAARQEDYEGGERLLLSVNRELIPLLRERKQPYHHLQISLLLHLADMYLREGDIESAADVLKESEETHHKLGNQLEGLPLWYQLNEKKALLHIQRFDYKGAIEIMENICRAFEEILSVLKNNCFAQNRFEDFDSEYYGDALCMLIYAMMFRQRENPELYGRLCELSDIALKQYPDHEEELERHRQYRCHIEMEAGNIDDAVRWLFAAKCWHPENIGKEELINFLNLVCENDDEIGRQYYLMYYILLMFEAGNRKHPLGDVMYQAMIQQKRLMKDMGLIQAETLTSYQEIPLTGIKEEDSGIKYHPMEIIYWKYASYLMNSGKEWGAEVYYKKAMELCFKYQEYDTMQITGVGVFAEYICCLVQAGDKKAAGKAYEQMIKKLEELQKKKLPAATRSFVLRMIEMAEKADKKKGKVDTQVLWSLARKITY